MEGLSQEHMAFRAGFCPLILTLTYQVPVCHLLWLCPEPEGATWSHNPFAELWGLLHCRQFATKTHVAIVSSGTCLTLQAGSVACAVRRCCQPGVADCRWTLTGLSDRNFTFSFHLPPQCVALHQMCLSVFIHSKACHAKRAADERLGWGYPPL